MTDHPANSTARKIVWFWVILTLRGILLCGSRARVLPPLAPLPESGGFILASNHISHFDPPLLAVHLPRPIDWLAMSELYSKSWSARFFRSVNAIPIQRGAPDRAAIREAVSRLKAGRVVGIFPEGGIRDGEASLLAGRPPLRGAALLARLSGAPVIPCAIVGSDRLYNRKHWRPGHRAPVWIATGHPLPPVNSDDEFSAHLVDAMRVLRERILTLGHATKDDLPKSPQERMRET